MTTVVFLVYPAPFTCVFEDS